MGESASELRPRAAGAPLEKATAPPPKKKKFSLPIRPKILPTTDHPPAIHHPRAQVRRTPVRMGVERRGGGRGKAAGGRGHTETNGRGQRLSPPRGEGPRASRARARDPSVGQRSTPRSTCHPYPARPTSLNHMMSGWRAHRGGWEGRERGGEAGRRRDGKGNARSSSIKRVHFLLLPSPHTPSPRGASRRHADPHCPPAAPAQGRHVKCGQGGGGSGGQLGLWTSPGSPQTPAIFFSP